MGVQRTGFLDSSSRVLSHIQQNFLREQVTSMSKLKLTLACWDYDRTRPLIDGRVKAEGIDLEVKV